MIAFVFVVVVNVQFGADVESLKSEFPPFSNSCDSECRGLGRLSFSGVRPSVVSRARSGTCPVLPRRMQRSSSKLGQLCHSASSLRSLQRRTVATRTKDSLSSHGTAPSRNDEFLEYVHGFVEETAQSRAQGKETVARKGAMSVIDRAANWAHVRPMRKRRTPPLGVPQLSMEKILSVPQDIFDEEMFNTELGEQVLPKGSFLEVRRSVYAESLPFPFVHDSGFAGATE